MTSPVSFRSRSAAVAALGDGSVLFCGAENALVRAGGGVVVEELQLDEGFVADRFAADGGLVVATHHDEERRVVFARPGSGRARVVRVPAMKHVTTRAIDGVGALQFNHERIRIVHEDGAVDDVGHVAGFGAITSDVPRDERAAPFFADVRWWSHDLLMSLRVKGDNGTEHFRWACVAGDGAVRFHGRGIDALPLSSSAAMVFDGAETLTIDRDGRRLVRFPFRLRGPNHVYDVPFVAVGAGEVVLSEVRAFEPTVTRVDPREPAARWRTRLDGAVSITSGPVRAGSRIVVGCYNYGDETHHLAILDAELGTVEREIAIDDNADVLVALADDAVAVLLHEKRAIVVRGLSSAAPEVVRLDHGDGLAMSIAVAPKLVAVATSSSVSCFSLA